MPTYEYECSACGAAKEEYQSITAPALTECTSCNQPTLKRKVGGGSATLRFKGSGFYITDYAKKESCPCGKPSQESGSCS